MRTAIRIELLNINRERACEHCRSRKDPPELKTDFSDEPNFDQDKNLIVASAATVTDSPLVLRPFASTTCTSLMLTAH
jgi:hypothetical protein